MTSEFQASSRNALALVLALSMAGSAGRILTSPTQCEQLPMPGSTLCKQEMMRTGSFEYLSLRDPSKCALLPDSTEAKRCIDANASGKDFLVTRTTLDRLQALQDSGMATPTVAMDPGERSALALETIATYTKLQAIVFTVTVGLGFLLGMVALTL